ncbi:MAG: glycosyltransferase, partial [Nitrospiraceae bacterium]|nr:glycosyltransferase [Nitrospiraceae bacterium]
PTLAACLESVKYALQQAQPPLSAEIFYVDGGSQDNSLAIAAEAGVDQTLGGEKRRRASENRNLGLRTAKGRYVQFVDGDMIVAPDWPQAAVRYLDQHPQTAAVCGNVREKTQSVLHQAMELDWLPREGAIRHCGGAAMFRRGPLEHFDGFPEDIPYGEEPYLCWCIRNQLGMDIYQLNQTMVDHDLGFKGSADYWRRNVRVGATYALIAARCARTNDPLWRHEAIANAAWAAAILAALALLVIGPLPVKALIAAAATVVIARKAAQTRRNGHPLTLAFVYALHTYFAKLPLAQGEVQWLAGRIFRPQKGKRP